MPDIQTIAQYTLAFIAGLFALYMIVYMVTAAFYSAQSKHKRSDYRLTDFNLNFPAGLALLLKEWIEEYQRMAVQKAKDRKDV
jgi:hypothetical protein